MKIDFTRYLNAQQQKVVDTTEGYVLVLAGAGSGKTHSIIYRTAHLIVNKGVLPENILLVTFTNKAANELKDRIRKYIHSDCRTMWVGTFHSVCLRILRAEYRSIPPYSSSFSVFDTDDQISVLKKVCKKLNIDTKIYPVQRVHNIISKQKNNIITPDLFFDYNEKNKYSYEIQRIYQEYENALQENNAMDFDDLLMKCAILFDHSPEIVKKYQEQFRYVTIDEYQDTNYVQFKIVNMLAKKHENLCVIGDDDQAIYSWRGANIRNILDFEKDYESVVVIHLEENYRSTPSILRLANSVIVHNQSRHPKELWTKKEEGAKPQLIVHDNEHAEADFVAGDVKDKLTSGILSNQIVILYRTNFQSRVLETAFNKYQIPYQIVGGVNFFQRREVKDLVDYLRVIINPQDIESILRVINVPNRSIGKTTISYLISYASEEQISLMEAIFQVKEIAGLTRKSRNGVEEFAQLVQKLSIIASNHKPAEIVKEVIRLSGLEEFYTDKDDIQTIARVENIKELLAHAEEYQEKYEQDNQMSPTLEQYLQNLSLQTDLDNRRVDTPVVRLMTMHNAKGMEFDYVYVVGLEDGLLPHSMSMNDNDDIEEERRLFYVAITRAKNSLQLHYAHTRRMGDTVQFNQPSRFLALVPDELLEKVNQSFYEIHASRYQPTPKKAKSPLLLESEKHFRIGQKVQHVEFGKGIILNVEGESEKAKLTISFQSGQLKKIIGNYVTIIEGTGI